MVVPASSQQTWTPAFTGVYDPDLVGAVGVWAHPGTLLVDVGASLGLWTVQLGRLARAAGGRVLAIEPVPANAEIVVDNVARNGLERVVEVAVVAAGSEPGRLKVATEVGGVGNAAVQRGDRRIVPGAGPHQADRDATEAETAVLTVPVAPLDDLVGDRAVAAIKLDVEGWEVPVLEGASRVLDRDRPFILGEFNRWWMDRHGIDPGRLWSLAGTHGYRVAEVLRPRIRPWSVIREVRLRPLRLGSLWDGDLVLWHPDMHGDWVRERLVASP